MKENSEEDIKNIEEIIELSKEEIDAKDENITSILDIEDLISLGHILSDYKKLQEDFEQIDNECNRLEVKEFKLENKINKLKDEMEKDKMEQFDDYVIYLIESYLEILEE